MIKSIAKANEKSFILLFNGWFPIQAPDLHATVFPVQGGLDCSWGHLTYTHARTAYVAVGLPISGVVASFDIHGWKWRIIIHPDQ